MFASDFIDFVKNLENDARVGFDVSKGLWFPHVSPEGGSDTIAYGHKIKPYEEWLFTDGISEDDASALLEKDLAAAYDVVFAHLDKAYDGLLMGLTTQQTEMLTEFVFNLGSLRSFPKFTRAVIEQDWVTAQRECERSYMDAYGMRHPLERRNRLFIERFF